MLEAIPTPEETERLEEYRAPEERVQLRDVEQNVMPLALLSRCVQRVRLLCIARTARSNFGGVSRSFGQVRTGCDALHKSNMLREVMLLALDLGNYINHGDSSKGARAISIGSILALKDFKTG